MNYDEIESQVINTFAKTDNVTLAYIDTDGRAAAAMMCIINDGLTAYMQTDKKFDKAAAIKKNPNVAMSIGAYSFKGRAEIMPGKCSDYDWYVDAIKKKIPLSYEHYTMLPDEVLIKITFDICKFLKLRGRECLYRVDLKNKTVTEQEIDKL